MLIYFDESYDNEHRYLLLGALFNPHPKFLHREFYELKKKYSYFDENSKPREIKYILITKRLVEAGKLLGIEVIDHVIVVKNGFISLKEKGLT